MHDDVVVELRQFVAGDGQSSFEGGFPFGAPSLHAGRAINQHDDFLLQAPDVRFVPIGPGKQQGQQQHDQHSQ